MSPRVELGESRLRARRKQRRLLLAGGSVAFVAVLFLFVWWLSCASFLQIITVEVEGANVVSVATVEQVVEQDIAGSYFHIFPKRNIFLYPKNGIIKELLAQYPTLGAVAVMAKDFHTLRVVVIERHPFALWCGRSLADAGRCLLLDSGGLAYADAPQYSGQVYDLYYGALGGDALPRQFLTSAQFHSLSALVAAFGKKVSPNTLQNIAVDTNNDVRLSFSGGYEILFALADDSGNVFERFSLTLTAAPFTTHTLSDFQYVDLRFGDKVYYKLKNQ